MERIGNFAFSSHVTHEEYDELRERILKHFSENYIFLCYQDYETGITGVRIGTIEMAEETLKKLEEVKDFIKEFPEVLKKHVHPDDIEGLIAVFDKEYCKNRLADTKSFEVQYRWGDGDSRRYNRLEIFKLNPEPEVRQVLMITRSIDEEIQERKSQDENERLYQSGIYALSREYSSIYYVNLDKEEVSPYNLSNRIEGMFGDKFYKMPYRSATDLYVDRAVLEREKIKMKLILSPEYIIKQLEDKEYFTKIYLNNENQYCEMKVVKIHTEDGSHVCVMGFGVKDDEIREDRDRRRKFAVQYSLLDGLCREYLCVWMITPDHKMSLYVSNDEHVDRMNTDISLDGIDWDEGMERYVKGYVVEDESEDMINTFKYDGLVKSIPDGGVFTYNYIRRYSEKKTKYIQFIAAKNKNPRGGYDIIAAFKDVDGIIRYQKSQEKKLNKALQQRDYDILTGLKNRFCFERSIKAYPGRRFETITCIYLDVNGLHELNNTEGHEAGDMMLRRVAKYITKIWGEDDTYRIGGDEFVIFVFDRSTDLINNDIDGFNKAVATYGYSVSVGFARENDDILDMRNFIREAETKMYVAKKDHYKGKNDRRHV